VDQATDRWAPEVLRDASEDESEGIYVVGIRESSDPKAWSLLFMECDEEDADLDLGMDSYCLVVDPGQATCYGGVRECELLGDRLRLLLTEEAAAALGMPTESRFRLELPADVLGMLRNGLTRVLVSGNPDSIPTRLAMSPRF
jgi:immunity protein 10 of polymorphic toxin system